MLKIPDNLLVHRVDLTLINTDDDLVVFERHKSIVHRGNIVEWGGSRVGVRVVRDKGDEYMQGVVIG